MTEITSNKTTSEVEVELKLLTDKRSAQRVWAHTAVKPYLNTPPRTRHIKTTYHDTPSHDLLQQRCALRVRHVGNQFEQHIKTAGNITGGAFHRHEWKTPLSSHIPDYKAWEKEAKTYIKPYKNSLSAIFESDMERTDGLIVGDDFSIEIAVDIGVIRTLEPITGATLSETPLVEVELELKSGTPLHIHKLARELVETLPLRVGWLSKAQRGYDLCLKMLPSPCKASKPQFPKSLSNTNAMGVILGNNLSHLLSNIPNIETACDPEAVHQARIACRQLRANLTLIKPLGDIEHIENLQSGFQSLAAQLSPIRDIDVLTQETLPHVINSSETPEDIKASLQKICETADKHRKANIRKTLSEIRSVNTAKLILDTAILVCTLSASTNTESIDNATQLLIQKRFKPLKKMQKDNLKDKLSDIHDLRIATKKLRYIIEAYATLKMSKPMQKYAKKLSMLQDNLGAINDLSAAEILLKTITPKTHNNFMAVGYVLGVYSHLIRFYQEEAIENCRRIEQPPVL